MPKEVYNVEHEYTLSHLICVLASLMLFSANSSASHFCSNRTSSSLNPCTSTSRCASRSFTTFAARMHASSTTNHFVNFWWWCLLFSFFLSLYLIFHYIMSPAGQGQPSETRVSRRASARLRDSPVKCASARSTASVTDRRPPACIQVTNDLTKGAHKM